jgi:hypothetical protein
VRLVTDQNANVVARHDYLPFGEEIPANTAGRNSQWGLTADVEQKFTGQIRDNETGMDYFNARYLTGALVGYAVGSMFGAGVNVSWVPATNQWYVGPTVNLSPGFWGGTGVSVTRFSFPNQQSAGNVLSSWSASVNFQPTPLTGTTVTKSSGSPSVVGYTAGSRVPVAFGAGYNWLGWKGKCQ